ncbi:hypothetical protein BO82DRAFT_363343 [Aspergillus uvarum CBS 121591]|uniref:Fungal N-terminal domain-containing protein n=1 Tax=Aspergillus uvarum CBS 121591 TaxID=1448315 RepID=A0A319CE23_9EURO|nr:hypothetical protein BO82DRAFT_363343 [Aspergillus uvarum CBS 121591]PYH83454.1 hypothetical protein BO82DRAFT_363343 [Aspergillus uvarum CBS 121591]
MSGLEVAVSVLSLIEASISLIGQLHDAYKRQKEHTSFLAGYAEELRSAKSIIRVDRHIREVLGDGRGLRIGNLVPDDEEADAKREIPLSREEVAAVMGPPGPSSSSSSTERIIENNLTQQQALQINGPVGEDRWKSISRLVVRQNRATGTSTQVNYPVSASTFYVLLVNHLVKSVLVCGLLYIPLAYLFQKHD